MTGRIVHYLLLLILVIEGGGNAPLRAADDLQPIVTIIYTAEAHGSLLPCDCPVEPLGGVARRATMINRYRARGPVVLVDAGGWTAGSKNDLDTLGDPELDALRTRLMNDAMKLMRYDAVLPGPHEAEVLTTLDSLPAPMASGVPIEITGRAKIPVRVYGWSETNVSLFGGKPSKLPEKWLTHLPNDPPYVEVVLSRQGEEGSERLATSMKTDVMVNAARIIKPRVTWKVGNTVLANFDFQAQKLGVIEVFPPAPGAKAPFDIRVRHDPLGPNIPDDPAIAALLRPYMTLLTKKERPKVTLEFWTMPECPGCIEARPELEQLAKDTAGRVDIVLRFLVHKRNGKFEMLHGERELEEARVQTVVQKYYPERIWEWLAWRESNRDAPWTDGARALGLLASRIRNALAAGEAEEMLETDMDLAPKRRVPGTPSFAIANRLVEVEAKRAMLLKGLCSVLEAPKPAACSGVPLCFDDRPCFKKGFIGRCVDAGKATARCDTTKPAVKVAGVVIVDKGCFYSNHETIVSIIEKDLPGVDFQIVDSADPQAKTLLETLRSKRLPVYLIDPIARTEVNPERVKEYTTQDPVSKWLVVGDERNGAHQLLSRPRTKGRADLFVSRYTKNGQEALEVALQSLLTDEMRNLSLYIHDALYWRDNAGQKELAGRGGGGKNELEEVARGLAVKKLHSAKNAPEKYTTYLIERGKVRDTGYWDRPLKKVGIDIEKVRELAEGPDPDILKQMEADADFLQSLDAAGEIVLLAENCELIRVNSRADLLAALAKIAQRKDDKGSK